jgi:hypothetical protein
MYFGDKPKAYKGMSCLTLYVPSCVNMVIKSKGNDMNQLTLIELYDVIVQLIEVKNSEHVALQHDPLQQAVSDRVYQNVIDLIRERVHNETAR